MMSFPDRAVSRFRSSPQPAAHSQRTSEPKGGGFEVPIRVRHSNRLKPVLAGAILAVPIVLSPSAAHAQISDDVVKIGVFTDLSEPAGQRQVLD